MTIIRPKIFSEFPQVDCGVSTKLGLGRGAPFYFNLSYSVGDDPEAVRQNRESFFAGFGLTEKDVAWQKQVHGDNISLPLNGGNCGESDAMITGRRNLALAVSTADCPPIFLFDPENMVIAAVHSGWRSTEKEISAKVIERMRSEYNSRPDNLLAYAGPSICGRCYEVGQEFESKFSPKYLTASADKFRLDLPLRNYDILLESGLKSSNIEIAPECTFESKDLLHSYRRDGLHSGRAMGLIVMKDEDAR